MSKLHEILAVEKTRTSVSSKLIQETHKKFGKSEYFQGFVKSLTMIEDSPQNKAVEDAAFEHRQLPTTVHETLEYVFKHWVDAEDVIFQKNVTNQSASADLHFRGDLLEASVPVDELLGLEVRLDVIRKLIDESPTLVASSTWVPDSESGRKGSWIIKNPEITTKTEKTTIPVVLYEATDKHPAQVKESTTDKTVGSFKLIKTSGALTSAQKAEMLATVDDLLSEVKQARMRANSVEASTRKIGKRLTDIIMKPLLG